MRRLKSRYSVIFIICVICVFFTLYVKRFPSKTSIVHFVIPICQGEVGLYDVFMKTLHEIFKTEWEYRVFVVHQKDSRACYWQALLNIGLKQSINQGEADCIVAQSVHQLPDNDFNYGKCTKPTKICQLLQSETCSYNYENDVDIYYDTISASPSHWKHIMQYTNKINFIYERLNNNYNTLFQSKLNNLESEIKPCKCVNISSKETSKSLSIVSSYRQKGKNEDLQKVIYFIHSTHLDRWESTRFYVKQWNINELKNNRNVVLEKYKLILFYNLKCGMTFWKCLLYKVEFDQDYPKTNLTGLFRHLSQYEDDDVLKMLFGKGWTKFTVVREPRERILSAFINKAVNKRDVQDKFCMAEAPSLSVFIDLIKICKNDHWASQIFLPPYLYKNMLIGRMGRKQNISLFIDNLLQNLGVYERVKHWMETSPRIAWAKHPTHAKDKIEKYYNKDLEREIISMYNSEYELFGFDDSYYM